MTHKTEKFQFAANGGKVVTLVSKKYCFEIENRFKEMIGEDKFNAFQKDNTIDLEITLEQVEKHFPRLLDFEGEEQKINWEDQDYDEIMRVISFFLRYRKNAQLRQLESQKEMIALTIEMMKKLMSLSPEDLSSKEKLETILGSLSQEVPASSIS
jgi:hypothetical protein